MFFLENVGNALSSLPSPPTTPHSIYQSNHSLSFINDDIPNEKLKISFKNGNCWAGFLSHNNLIIENLNWDNVEDIRYTIVAIIDLAESCLNCQNVIIALDKSINDLTSLIHSFFYVGGQILDESNLTFKLNHGFLCVGLQV